MGPPMKPAVCRARRNTRVSSRSSPTCGVTRSRKGMLFGALLRMDIKSFHRLFDVTENLSRISSNDSVRGDILRDDATSAYNRVLADVGVRKNRGARADGCTFPDDSAFDLPVSFSLQISFEGRGTGIAVIDERHSVPDEDVVLDDHAFADKRVAGYFAALADPCISLDLHECADLCLVSDFTSVEIYEL